MKNPIKAFICWRNRRIARRGLLRLRELIAGKECFARGATARDARGAPCDPISPKAASFSLSGGCVAVADGWTEMLLLIGTLQEAKDDLRPWISLRYYNDRYGHEGAIALIDRALEKL